MIRINKANSQDSDLISYLGQQTFQETFGDLFLPDELNEYLSTTFNPIKIQASLLKESNKYYILYYEDKPIGYYKLKLDSKSDDKEGLKQIQLQKIYILKDYLDMKLGVIMIEEIVEFARIHNYDLMWLVVLQTNLRAIHFYKKHGFEILKEHIYQIGSKNLKFHIMIKTIQP